MASWKEAFEVVNTALGAISSAGSIPGVNLIPYVGIVTSAAGALQLALNAGMKVAPYIEAIKDTFSDGLPSDEQMRALDAKIDELRALIHAPLPPPEEGEPA